MTYERCIPDVSSAAASPADEDRPHGRQKHGAYKVKRVLQQAMDQGISLIDRRTTGGRLMWERRENLVAALGGASEVSPQRLEIIDSYIRTRFLLDHVDAYLIELGPKIINRRHKTLAPVIAQRQSLADSLLRHLQAIGMDRKAKSVADLDSYLKNRGGPSSR